MDDGPLLLHSLATFRTLLTGCLDAVAPRRLCEVGSEFGGTTKLLLEWARDHDAALWTVEPYPAQDLVELDGAEERFTLVRGRSPEALADVPGADAWVIDGDHNHWTVTRELQSAFSGEAPALAVLHDCAWPCARRDQYYDPSALPPEGVHPHSYELGALPGVAELQPGGMRGEGQFAYALREGGPANGVLTAVEDFVGARPELEHHVVPLVFGVGFVFPTAAPWADAVRELLTPLAGSELMTTLESNRLRLYLSVIELQDRVTALAARHSSLAAEYERRAAADAAELARLRLERAQALSQ